MRLAARCFVIGALMVAACSKQSGPSAAAFDEQLWHSESGFGENDAKRFSMLEDLQRKIRPGMNKGSVIALLGEPFRKDVQLRHEQANVREKWIYPLKTIRSRGETMLLEFVVGFNDDGKVITTGENGE